jgi:phosphate transport system substrate-binding protein
MVFNRYYLPITLLFLAGCQSSAPTGPVLLRGSGASFPQRAYAKWISDYVAERSRLVKIEYTPNGTVQGVEDLIGGKVDFAGSDLPLTDEQMAKLKQKPLHFPAFLGAVVPVFNIPGTTRLNFSASVLAGLFSGRITAWNDPAIVALNPEATLPALAVKTVHRGDGSGSTYLLTRYLAQDKAWKEKFGQSTTVKWPAGGIAVSGSEAMADEVAKTPGTLGYVELNYANQKQLSQGAVQNATGKFQRATFESVGAAIDEKALGEDFRGQAINASSEKAYPIAALTYLIVPSSFGENAAKAKQMRFFLEWIYTLDGQKAVNSLDYDLLDNELVQEIGRQVNKIN